MGMRDWKEGKVTEQIHPRVCRVELQGGRSYRRNRVCFQPDGGIIAPNGAPASRHKAMQDKKGQLPLSVAIAPTDEVIEYLTLIAGRSAVVVLLRAFSFCSGCRWRRWDRWRSFKGFLVRSPQMNICRCGALLINIRRFSKCSKLYIQL